MARKLILMALVTVLLAPAFASAGGFATVGLAPPPETVGPGDTWTADMTVLQHGRTPVDWLEPAPVVWIRSADGTAERSFQSRSTGRDGIYRAQVIFPASGRWSYEVDTFGRLHTFAAIRIGDDEVAPAATGADSIVGPLSLGLGAALLAALLTALAQRRRAPAAA